jgi:predicted transcriptional regulator
MMASRREDRPPQVNIRLDPSDAEVLAALAFLTDSSSAEVVRPAVEDFLRKQRDDPQVQAALKIREKRRRASRR